MRHPSNLAPSSPRPYGGSILDALTPEVLQEHVDLLRSMNGTALKATLVPHRGLPTYDPAGYLIAYRDIITPRSFDKVVARIWSKEDPSFVDLKKEYDLGVVFASSAIRKVQRDLRALPLVIDQELDPRKKRLIERYLFDSDTQTVRRLTGRDERVNYSLVIGLDRFVDHCKEVVPELMDDGGDELRRGCHDYISVTALLEADEAVESKVMRQSLGKASLLPFRRVQK